MRSRSSCRMRPRLLVDRGERLVHQQHPAGSTASARARPTRCCMPPESCQPDRLARSCRQARPWQARARAASVRSAAGAPPRKQPKFGVLARGRPRQQGEILEHQARLAAARAADGAAADEDAARVRGQQAGDAFQQRGLAAAARADEREKLPRLHQDIDVGERLHAAEALRQALDGDADRCAHPARQRRRRASSRASTASATPASTSVQATVANILSCSNIEREFMISLPRPKGESSSSATISPRNARDRPRRQAGEDHRQRAGQHDACEELAPGGAEGTRHFQQPRPCIARTPPYAFMVMNGALKTKMITAEETMLIPNDRMTSGIRRRSEAQSGDRGRRAPRARRRAPCPSAGRAARRSGSRRRSQGRATAG